MVAGDAPGLTATKIENKIVLRTVQNADITLVDVRVPEADRLQRADSFKDTARGDRSERLRLGFRHIADLARRSAKSWRG